jgi:predicted alpha/beta-fold hydrolase
VVPKPASAHHGVDASLLHTSLLHTSLLHTSLLHTSLLHRYLVKEAAALEATMQGLAQSADFIALENAKLKREQSTGLVARVVGRFMVRTMRDKLVAAQAAERTMRSNQAEVHARVVQAEQKCTAMEREMMISRRRQVMAP